MRGILTVIGFDKVGIVYRVSEKLAGFNANILDIDQTIMQGYFTMVVLVDLTQANEEFGNMQSEFTELGEEMGLEIKFQNEKIFNAMYNV
jgi:ACT domain-containing protein